MNSLWIPFFAAIFGVALANYGVPAPAPIPGLYYPPMHPWGRPPRYNSRSNSRSDSEEHRRKRCNNCKNLKTSKVETEMETHAPDFSYYTDKKGCRRAAISCPMDNVKYFMAVEDKDNTLHYISTGTHIERVVKCNKKGKYESTVIESGDDVTFSKVICLKPPTGK